MDNAVAWCEFTILVRMSFFSRSDAVAAERFLWAKVVLFFLFLGSLFICAASYSKDGGVVVHGFVSYRVGLTTVAKFKVAVR